MGIRYNEISNFSSENEFIYGIQRAGRGQQSGRKTVMLIGYITSSMLSTLNCEHEAGLEID